MNHRTGPAPAAARAVVPQLSRYPLRPRIDGDFDLTRLLAAARTPEQTNAMAEPRVGAGEAAVALRLWDLKAAAATTAAGGPQVDTMTGAGPPLRGLRRGGPPLPADLQALHALETGPLLKPLVAERTAALTPAVARAWLTLAAHWVGVAAAIADLRFLNGACKLLGAVSVHQAAPTLQDHIASVAGLIESATLDLQLQLANRLPFPLEELGSAATAGAQPPAHPARPGGDGPASPPRVMILARGGSDSPAYLAKMTAAHGASLAAICWYQSSEESSDQADRPPSGYADAWYPPAGKPSTQAKPRLPKSLPQLHACGWDQAAAAIYSHDTDLVLLAGMPIVPVAVLDQARLGAVNAHNGALPTYRGMDAVAWAILNNDPIVCSLHRAAPGVDTGEVYAATAVPLAPAGTLRARVKHTQLQLLAAAAAHVTATGALPAGAAQPAGLGRQFYRLHPHLKRVLDISPVRADTRASGTS
jgi:formyl transferase-like protein